MSISESEQITITEKLNTENQFNVPISKEKVSGNSTNYYDKNLRKLKKIEVISLKIDSVTRHTRGLLGIYNNI